jgi:hypothetical protein
MTECINTQTFKAKSTMMATMNMPSTSAATAPRDKSEPATTTAKTATKTTSSSAKNGLANEDIDTALFGSLNASVADSLTDHIDTALKAGVLTLPLMNDDTTNGTVTGTRSEKLLAALRNVYWRNVDVFEVYAGRNIFSVGMYPPKRRRAIEQLYNSDGDNDNDAKEASSSSIKDKKSPLQDVSASKMNETANDTANNNSKPSATSTNANANTSNSNSNLYPTPDQIPTAQEMADMTNECEQLREQLWQVQRRRNETVHAMNQLEVAEQLADMASSSMQESMDAEGNGIEQVHDSVTAAVVGSEGLEQLQATGKELVEKLEQEKRQRSDGDDENDDDDDVEMLNASKKKKELTLEERYQEERKTFSNPESLANVQRMIQEQ